MREPARIDEYIETLKEIWEKYPDLRFTQLILNVFNNPADYYKEDAETLDKLKAYYLG